MANCKDCLYYECCKTLNKDFIKHPKDYENNERMSEICTTFKDINRFMKLPCKVGDTVYLMVKYNKDEFGNYCTGIVSGIHVTDKKSNGPYSKRFDYLVVRFPTTDSIKHINFKEIGKTVFLTREEAEKALEEREQE